MQDPKPLNYAVLGDGRFFRCPGGEVIDLGRVLMVNDFRAKEGLTADMRFSFQIILEGGVGCTIHNLSTDEERAKTYYELFIGAWVRWHAPVKVDTSRGGIAFCADPQNQLHGFGGPNVP